MIFRYDKLVYWIINYKYFILKFVLKILFKILTSQINIFSVFHKFKTEL